MTLARPTARSTRSTRPALRGAVLALSVSGVALVGVLAVGAAPAAAAAPAGSVTPFVDCIWVNTDGTVTASVGYTSTNAGTVSVPVGTDNRVAPGAADRGQPTTFDPGTHRGEWAPTLSATYIAQGVNWTVTGRSVQVVSLTPCATKPFPAQGNQLAYLATLALVSGAGTVVLGARQVRRRAGAVA